MGSVANPAGAKRKTGTAGSYADYGVRRDEAVRSGGIYIERTWRHTQRAVDLEYETVADLEGGSMRVWNAGYREKDTIAGRVKRTSGMDWLYIGVCVILLFILAGFAGVYASDCRKVSELQKSIQTRNSGYEDTQKKIETVQLQLQALSNDDVIRNEAINNRGMMRVNNDHRRTVYIQNLDPGTVTADTQTEKTKFELLDVVLSLLDLLHIGS